MICATALAALSLPLRTAALPAPKRQAWPRRRGTPALELPTHEAAPWRLADAKGQVVVLNFWASWCEPCRAEMPALERLAQRHAADRLLVVAVNYRESEAAIRRFIEAVPLTLPILRDADGAAARAWDVRIFPTTIVVGRSGRAVFSVIGEVDWSADPPRQWVTALL